MNAIELNQEGKAYSPIGKKDRLMLWALSPIVSPLIIAFPLTFVLTWFYSRFVGSALTIAELTGIIFGVSSVAGLPLMLMYIHKKKIPLINRKNVTPFGISKQDVLFMLWYIPLAIAVIYGGSAVLEGVFGVSDSINQETIQSLMGDIPLSIMFFAIVISAPFTEEWLFRGVMLFKNGETTPTWKGVIWSSVAFGLLHMPTDIPSVYVYFTMGLVLGFAVKHTRSIEVAIFIHLVNNLFGFIALSMI